MKRQGTTQMPRFIVGALATAGISAANGATVQIAFVDNVLSNDSGYSFTADLTGDGVGDVNGHLTQQQIMHWALLGNVDGGPHFGGAIAGSYRGAYRVAFVGGNYLRVLGVGATTVRDFVSFGFSKGGVNGGLRTGGWLDLTATAVEKTGGVHSAKVQIHRLIFDDTSRDAPVGVSTGITYPTWSASVAAVPEPSSSLALLALGAGGLLMRRRL